MPFSLRNASNTFQRLLNEVFRDIPNVFVYVDNILVASRSPLEHKSDVIRVLETLRKNNLAASLQKSKFYKDKLTFLGHRVSGKGSSIPSNRIRALVDIAAPDTPKAMQKFLGTINFYRRYIPNFSAVAQPLLR